MKITAMAHGSNGWGYKISGQVERKRGPKCGFMLDAFTPRLAFDKLIDSLIYAAINFQYMARYENISGIELITTRRSIHE